MTSQFRHACDSGGGTAEDAAVTVAGVAINAENAAIKPPVI
jgi:hypothetical protein